MLGDDAGAGRGEQVPELAQRMQIRQIQGPEVHQREVRETLQPVHLDAQFGADTTGRPLATDEVIGIHSQAVAVVVGQLSSHHLSDLGAVLQPPPLPDVDQRVAVGAGHHHRLENGLRAALPRLTWHTAIAGRGDHGALLVDRRKAPPSMRGLRHQR
jgi:hypothetical protein